jgi:hypothetical protein
MPVRDFSRPKTYRQGGLLVGHDHDAGGLDHGLDWGAGLEAHVFGRFLVMTDTISTPPASMITSALTMPMLTALTVPGMRLRALTFMMGLPCRYRFPDKPSLQLLFGTLGFPSPIQEFFL